MLIREMQFIAAGAHGGPITLLARRHGEYVRPVRATEIDMRIEDNPNVPKVICRMDATWIARHPTEDLYLVYDGLHNSYHSRVNEKELEEWEENWKREIVKFPPRGKTPEADIPRKIYEMPTAKGVAWWEWAVGFNNYEMVKAPKRPRATEMTPDDVDEQGGENPTVETKILRIFDGAGRHGEIHTKILTTPLDLIRFTNYSRNI